MVNIILFSGNNKTADIISRIAGKAGFNLMLEKTAASGAWNLDKADILLLDIVNPNKNHIKPVGALDNLIESLGSFEKGKIAILLPGQIDFFLKNSTGFDDFIFPERLEDELIVRINFLLSKMKLAAPGNSITVGDLLLNMDKYEIVVNRKVIELTYKEFELLKILMQNQNKVFTRINLLSSVWGYDFYGGSRTVDVHMRRLRAKIPPPYNNMLKTIRNVGYMFSPDYLSG
jgi:DNA-binding winged helix-turn-helix (wHTH) protein